MRFKIIIALAVIFSLASSTAIFAATTTLHNSVPLKAKTTKTTTHPRIRHKKIKRLFSCYRDYCGRDKVICSPTPPTGMCTTDAQLVDICTQYGSCQIINGACQAVKKPQWSMCLNCVSACKDTAAKDWSAGQKCVKACITQKSTR